MKKLDNKSLAALNEESEDDNPIMGPGAMVKIGGNNNNNLGSGANQFNQPQQLNQPQPSQNPQGMGAGLGGLNSLSAIPALDFEVGGSTANKVASDSYVPTFAVGGAGRRPRRMLGQNY